MAVEVNLQSVEDIQFMPSERAIFNVLKATLQYPANPQAKAGKLTADIKFFCKSAEGEEAVNGLLWDIWAMILEISQKIPPGHPWQVSLIESLHNLRQRHGSILGRGKSSMLWKDLPNLSACVREKWIDPTDSIKNPNNSIEDSDNSVENPGDSTKKSGSSEEDTSDSTEDPDNAMEDAGALKEDPGSSKGGTSNSMVDTGDSMEDLDGATEDQDEDEEDPSDKFTNWVNLNSFIAGLTSKGVAIWLNFPIWQLRAALEEPTVKGPAMECRLQVVIEWILHSAGPILKYMKPKEDEAANKNLARALRTGPLCEGKAPRSVERWNFWKKRLSELSGELCSLEVDAGMKGRISDALRSMEVAEK